jgi:hypothetical protein
MHRTNHAREPIANPGAMRAEEGSTGTTSRNRFLYMYMDAVYVPHDAITARLGRGRHQVGSHIRGRNPKSTESNLQQTSPQL